jgi:hypothetical protein
VTKQGQHHDSTQPLILLASNVMVECRTSHFQLLYHFDRLFTPCYTLRQVFIFPVFKTRSDVLLTPKVFVLFRDVHFDPESHMEPEKIVHNFYLVSLCLDRSLPLGRLQQLILFARAQQLLFRTISR